MKQVSENCKMETIMVYNWFLSMTIEFSELGKITLSDNLSQLLTYAPSALLDFKSLIRNLQVLK